MKSTIIKILLSLLAILSLTACGGPNRKDPQSVADAALKCWISQDFKGLQKLVYPENEQAKQAFEQLGKFAEEMKAKSGKDDSQKEKRDFKDYEMKSMKDPFGYELNDDTKELKVRYRYSEGGNVTIELQKIDGKWYLYCIPLM